MTQKAKSRQEIAQEYGISARTLCRWIKKNQLLIPNGLISPKDQDLINEKF
jgi:transposase-like protein